MPLKTIDTGLGLIGYEDQGETVRPTALLWPSLFSDHSMWDAQVGALRSAGWRTLALDPPGHGRSPGPGRVFTMDECTDVAVQMLQLIPQQAPVVMLGTSWGGMIAPRLAYRYPDRIKALVLFNTTAERPDFQTRITAQLLTVLLAIRPLDQTVNNMLLSLQLAEATRKNRPEIGKALASGFRSYDRRALIRSVDSVLVKRDAFLDKLAEVKTPTLVVSGAQDTILPTSMAKRIAARMRNASQIEVENAAHLVPLEQPEMANKLIMDFVGHIDAARA